MSLEDREVRAADAGRDHTELDLAFRRLWFVELLDRNVSDFAADCGFHSDVIPGSRCPAIRPPSATNSEHVEY